MSTNADPLGIFAPPKVRPRDGNLGQRNNNPGNLKDPTTNQIASYDSPAKGWQTLRNDLTGKMTGRTKTGLGPNSSLYEFAQVYAPEQDKNNPKAYAERIARDLGVKPDAPIGQLDVDRFSQAVATAEGYYDKKPAQKKADASDPLGMFKPTKKAPDASDPLGMFQAPPETRKEPAKPTPAHNPLMSSVFTTATGVSMPELYEQYLADFNAKLPQSLRGSYAVRLAEEFSKTVPELGEFVTSPMGIALIVLNKNPYARPVGAAIDIAFGLQSSAHAASTAVGMVKDRNGSPERVIELITAATFGALGLKGGGKMWESGTSKYHGQPLEERLKLQADIKADTDPGKKISQLLSIKPKEAVEKFKAAAYKHPGLRDVATMVGIPKPRLGEVAVDIQRDRTKLLRLGKHQSDYDAFLLRRTVSDEGELAITKMGYAQQGDLPLDQLSPEGRQALSEFRRHQTEQVAKIKDFYGEKMPLQDAQEYITQMWDMNDLKRQIKERKGLTVSEEDLAPQVTERVVMKDRYFRQRKIPSYKVGMEEGIEYQGENYKLKPLFDNVVDVMKRRDEVLTRAIANQRQANVLREMGVILNEAEAKKLDVVGWYKKAPEATALARASYAGKLPEGDPYFEERPVYVHPDFEMLVNSSFGKSVKSGTLGGTLVALDNARAVSKTAVLHLSLFHFRALSEGGVAEHALRANPIKTLQQVFVFNPEFWKSIKTGIWEIGGKENGGYDPPKMRPENQGVVRDMLESGVNMISTDQENAVVGWMKNFGKDLPTAGRVATKPLRMAGNLAHAFNKSLWDFFHQGHQITAWNTILADETKRLGKSATDLQVKEVKQAMADHINNVYGSLNMEDLLMSPQSRYWANMLLLAPVWTASNLRTPLQAMEGEIGYRLANKWIAGAALSWFLSSQMLNYATTSWYNTPDKNGKRGGHFTWDNAGAPLDIHGQIVGDLSENALKIEVGYNRETGQMRYISTGSAYTDVFKLFLDPIKFLGTKMGLIPRQLIVQLSGHEAGSGYEQINFKKDPLSTERLLQMINAVSGMFLPIPVRAGAQAAGHVLAPTAISKPSFPMDEMQFAGFQTTSGLTVSKAARALRLAIDAHRADVVQAIMRAAVLNHIDPKKVEQQYRKDVATDKRAKRKPAFTFDVYGNRQAVAPPPVRGE